MTTANNAIPLVPENTLDPAAGLNLSLNAIDALLQTIVVDLLVNDPPVSPTAGQQWIVGPAPTGAWVGQENKMARWDGFVWQFYQPVLVLNTANTSLYKFVSGAWSELTSSTGIQTFIGQTDTPTAYAGNALKLPRVGASELELEFAWPLDTASIHEVRSAADLPAAVSGVITLPAKAILLHNSIYIGTDALEFQAGTSLVSYGGGQSITSDATGGVLRATNVASPIIIRGVVIVATAGPVFNMSQAALDQQFNAGFVGFYGPSVGTLSGFDVISFKDCFGSTADGVRFDGSPNKIFLSACPFYGITAGNAAITFASTLVARRVDMETNFFKSDPASVAIRAEAGYSVMKGRVIGSMREGPTQMLDGLVSSDLNWRFRGNDGIRDSRTAGQASLDAQTTVPITVQNQYEPINGTFTLANLSERVTLNANHEFVYNDTDQPIMVTFTAALTLDPANNVRVGIRVLKNGVDLPDVEAFIEQGAGGNNQPRPGFMSSLVELDPGESAGVCIANLTDTSDVTVLTATINLSS